MTDKEFRELALKCQNGTATDAEQEAFERAYQLMLTRHTDWDNELMGDEDKVRQTVLNKLMSDVEKQEHQKRQFLPFRYIAAASILIILSVGSYFYFHQSKLAKQVAQIPAHDVLPGGNKAILTLAGGSKIVLSNSKNGTLAQQGNATIVKTASGQVSYTVSNVPTTQQVFMNTITTPRGGKWYLTLADGTKVWLNAASSITYPTVFTGNERKVSITGEAYFEVTHDATKPFKVNFNNQTVQVLGTHFNINGYNDEPENRTTLVEGSIRISNALTSALLKPGQQAQVKPSGNAKIEVVTDKDIERTLAWKNGLFIFNSTDLYTLMRELSRWYNVDIEYQGNVKDDVFYGKIKQDNNLSQILKVLELGDVHFRIEGKKLIVLP